MDRRAVYLGLLLFAATVLTVWALALILWPFLVPIAWATCLVTVTGGMYRRLASWSRRPRLSAAVLTVGVALGVIVPLAVVGTAIAQQALALSARATPKAPPPSPGKPPAAPPAAPAASSDRWDQFFADHPDLDEWRQRVDDRLRAFDTDLRALADAALGQLGQPFARGAVNVLQGVFSLAFGFLLMLATYYVLLRDGDAIRQIVVDVVPMKEGDTKAILETLRSTAYAAIVGGLLTSLAQGTLGGVALWATGVSAPVLWGFVMAVLSLLPVGGTAFVWAPVAVYFLTTGDPVRGWFLVAFGVGVLSTCDNLLRPWLMRRAGATGIHPLLLFFAVISGIGVFGPSGIVFGPLLVAFVLAALRVYRDHFGRRAVAARAAAAAAEPPVAP